MGTLIAAVVIVGLIFYAVKDLLADKDFSAWTNIALTSLILFTVILSIFMILRRAPEPAPAAPEPAPAPQSAPANIPPEDMTEEQIKEAIAKEYLAVKADCEQNTPELDCPGFAANFLINKYKFTALEWESFMQEAAELGLLGGNAPAAVDAAQGEHGLQIQQTGHAAEGSAPAPLEPEPQTPAAEPPAPVAAAPSPAQQSAPKAKPQAKPAAATPQPDSGVNYLIRE